MRTVLLLLVRGPTRVALLRSVPERRKEPCCVGDRAQRQRKRDTLLQGFLLSHGIVHTVGCGERGRGNVRAGVHAPEAEAGLQEPMSTSFALYSNHAGLCVAWRTVRLKIKARLVILQPAQRSFGLCQNRDLPYIPGGTVQLR